MEAIRRTTSILANDPNGVAESQTPAGGGDLSLDGVLVTDGTAVFPEAQIVTATFAANDTARTLTVTYQDAGGSRVSGTIAGANATTSKSTFYAKEVYSISIDSGAAGAIEIGVLAADGMLGAPHQINRLQSPFNVSLFGEVIAGTLQYSMQFTPDDPHEDYPTSFSVDASWRDVVDLTDLAINGESNIAFPVEAVRFKMGAGATDGVVKYTILQGQDY